VLGGSHCEVFDTAILKSEQAELQLEGELKGALDRREFQLHYQPIVSLASNQIVGFEALVRWQHPVLGMIAPLDFIPIAERTGFIVPLGNWILREACLRLKDWQDSQPLSTDLWMSVNLSGVQLKDPALTERIGGALRDAALEARSLVLELTEGIAIENPAAVKTLLMQLRAMGVRISIDDFGTGYSSLAYLRQFPVDALKVDRSFVRGMETHKDTADIIGGLIAMAQQLGLHVVAEGVENEEQVTLLRSLNCASAQGYLFAKPLDVHKVADLLKTGLSSRSGNAAHKESASALRPGGPRPESQDDRTLPPIGRWLSITAAAVLVILTSKGLVTRFTNGLRPAVPSSSPLPLESAEQGLPVGTVADAGVPVRTSDVFLESAAPGAPAALRRKEDLSATSSAPRPAVATSNATATAGPGRTSAPAPQTSGAAVQEVTSLTVVHLHRVGSCQGRLIVSRDGVAFIPDETTAKDGFALKYREFLHTLADGRLTIKSNTRTYRFKTAAIAGIVDDGAPLRDVVERIARFH